MCRNIHVLFNFDPPATDDEIQAAALQYVRKVSGYAKPSQTNAAAFDVAVDDISGATARLVASLSTDRAPRNREDEAAKAHQRALQRFGE